LATDTRTDISKKEGTSPFGAESVQFVSFLIADFPAIRCPRMDSRVFEGSKHVGASLYTRQEGPVFARTALMVNAIKFFEERT